MPCPVCDAALVCASCRNHLEDAIPSAVSSDEPLVNEDGSPIFDDGANDDEDTVSIAIGYDGDTGMVIVNFAKPTNWLALSPENAEDLANAILENTAESRKEMKAKMD